MIGDQDSLWHSMAPILSESTAALHPLARELANHVSLNVRLVAKDQLS